MIRIILWTIVLCFLTTIGTAQNDFFKQPTFSISFYNHSVGIPFVDYFKTPMNIGVAVGATFTYKQKEISSIHQKIEIGWFRHKELNSALWVKTDFVRRFTAKNGLFGEAQFGVGYLRDFNAYDTYVLGENGIYEKKKNAGTGSVIFGGGLGGGYQFEVNDKLIVAPFVRYEGFLQAPYSEFLPAFPHALFHIGSQFKLK